VKDTSWGPHVQAQDELARSNQLRLYLNLAYLKGSFNEMAEFAPGNRRA